MSETNNSYKIYASKNYVDERALPQDAGEYKQLVTGADGEWKAEDRLAWKGNEQKTLIPLKTIEFSESNGIYFAQAEVPDNVTVSVGKEVAVQYDGTEYDLMVSEVNGLLAFGNLYFVDPSLENTEEPFCFLFEFPGLVTIGTTDAATSHDVSVVVTSYSVKLIDEDLIPLSVTPYIIDFEKLRESVNSSTEGRWVGDFSKLYSELIEAIKGNRAIFFRNFNGTKSGELLAVDRSFFHTENQYVSLLVTDISGVEVDHRTYHIMNNRIDFETVYAELPNPIPAEYITGTTVTDTDNGKFLGITDGAVGLMEVPKELPENPGNYKSLVTDGEGKWLAADRLAWKESKVESKTLYHFTKKANDFTFGIFMTSDNLIPDCVVGNTYHVECPQLGVDDVVVCDSFELKSPRLLIEGKLSIYYDFMENATSFVNEAGNYEADKSYDFVISEQAEVETTHPIPAEYITGAPLTDTDNGKLLGVVEGSIGLIEGIATETYVDTQINNLSTVAATGSWNELEDKPFGDESVNITKEVTAYLPAVVTYANVMHNYITNENPFPELELKEGIAYIFNFDDGERIFIEIPYEYNGHLAVGDSSLADGISTTIGSDPQKFFYGYVNDGYYLLLRDNDATESVAHTINITNSDIKTLDEQFIPQTIARAEELNGLASEDYVNTQIANQTTETWTFTLADGTTVTKTVVVK